MAGTRFTQRRIMRVTCSKSSPAPPLPVARARLFQLLRSHARVLAPTSICKRLAAWILKKKAPTTDRRVEAQGISKRHAPLGRSMPALSYGAGD